MTTINPYTPYSTAASGGTTPKNSSKNANSSMSNGAAQTGDAISQFLEYQKMTPEEKMRDAILKKLDMTEEGLAALPPEERAKVEEEIKQLIKEEIENRLAAKGTFINISA